MSPFPLTAIVHSAADDGIPDIVLDAVPPELDISSVLVDVYNVDNLLLSWLAVDTDNSCDRRHSMLRASPCNQASPEAGAVTAIVQNLSIIRVGAGVGTGVGAGVSAIKNSSDRDSIALVVSRISTVKVLPQARSVGTSYE